ncbi:SDR family NAD(P)-dependent oxidoreductase [Pseudonocardia acaciae]|uniref:SDR family NAD(P)-dependent oxidoreductase n=1 Tax=Pseudonocardia acaciae TaxID=551276 RepID=UPI00056B428F|nr:SDR family NAD(P)-dependent oxidoreductase [Pseudonocardia acaciae]
MASVDATRFGPWAVVTGASSGIGREFARQLAASGVHVVLIARRESLLREVGHELTARYGVRHRAAGTTRTWRGGPGGGLGEPARRPEHGQRGRDEGLRAHAGKGLHAEFAEHGVTLSVLLPGPTDTPVLSELGFQPDGSPIKPMAVDQCVAEGLDALASNRATHIAGRLNRVMDRMVPSRVTSMMMGRMVGRWVLRKDPSKVGSADE